MTAGPIITVRGEATRDVPPEIATVQATVFARDRDRQAALRRLAERARALQQLLDGYAAGIEERHTSGLYVYPQLRESGERVAEYSGSVNTAFTVTDLSILGELMLALASQEQTSVAGPFWSLRPDSPAYRDVRRVAITDALRRAHEYADALGARVIALVELSDAADRGGGFQPMSRDVAAFSAAGAGPPALDLDPQQQRITAAVTARFTISEPEALDRR
jgi:uncharacterized protein